MLIEGDTKVKTICDAKKDRKQLSEKERKRRKDIERERLKYIVTKLTPIQNRPSML